MHGLTSECRRQLAEINLHFHDLRREAGSRLLDAGVPLSVIQAFLDHANISTSSRYLKVTQDGLDVALKQYEEIFFFKQKTAYEMKNVYPFDQPLSDKSFQ